MASIMRYDPFREALSMRAAMNRLFEQSFVHPTWALPNGTRTMGTPMDVTETEQGYQVAVLLPGVKPEDVELTVQENTLTVKGQYKHSTEETTKGNWLVREIGSGSFQRSVTLPKTIDGDKVETSYENGKLIISVPVSEASRPKRISITNGQTEQKAVEAETENK